MFEIKELQKRGSKYSLSAIFEDKGAYSIRGIEAKEIFYILIGSYKDFTGSVKFENENYFDDAGKNCFQVSSLKYGLYDPNRTLDYNLNVIFEHTDEEKVNKLLVESGLINYRYRILLSLDAKTIVDFTWLCACLSKRPVIIALGNPPKWAEGYLNDRLILCFIEDKTKGEYEIDKAEFENRVLAKDIKGRGFNFKWCRFLNLVVSCLLFVGLLAFGIISDLTKINYDNINNSLITRDYINKNLADLSCDYIRNNYEEDKKYGVSTFDFEFWDTHQPSPDNNFLPQFQIGYRKNLSPFAPIKSYNQSAFKDKNIYLFQRFGMDMRYIKTSDHFYSSFSDYMPGNTELPYQSYFFIADNLPRDYLIAGKMPGNGEMLGNKALFKTLRQIKQLWVDGSLIDVSSFSDEDFIGKTIGLYQFDDYKEIKKWNSLNNWDYDYDYLEFTISGLYDFNSLFNGFFGMPLDLNTEEYYHYLDSLWINYDNVESDAYYNFDIFPIVSLNSNDLIKLHITESSFGENNYLNFSLIYDFSDTNYDMTYFHNVFEFDSKYNVYISETNRFDASVEYEINSNGEKNVIANGFKTYRGYCIIDRFMDSFNYCYAHPLEPWQFTASLLFSIFFSLSLTFNLMLTKEKAGYKRFNYFSKEKPRVNRIFINILVVLGVFIVTLIVITIGGWLYATAPGLAACGTRMNFFFPLNRLVSQNALVLAPLLIPFVYEVIRYIMLKKNKIY